MIRSIRDKRIELIAAGMAPKGFPSDLIRVARRKLFMLDNAKVLDDLKVPPGNRLEALKGDRIGQFSIRINDQFRICFNWDHGNADNVEIVDYHKGDCMSLSFDPPIHPGEVLREEFLLPLGLKPYSVAKMLRVPRTRIERLAAERTAVSPDTALRLAKLLGTTPDFWLNMQASYDLAVEATALRDELDAIEALNAA